MNAKALCCIKIGYVVRRVAVLRRFRSHCSGPL